MNIIHWHADIKPIIHDDGSVTLQQTWRSEDGDVQMRISTMRFEDWCDMQNALEDPEVARRAIDYLKEQFSDNSP